MLNQDTHSNNIADPFQVVCNEHQAYISAGPLLSFFCDDVGKPPLPFDGAERVLGNGLSSAVKSFEFLNPFPVSFNSSGEFTTLDNFAVSV